MLSPQDEAIRRVGCDIAERVIKRIRPEALQRYDIQKIARKAFSKVAPLGPIDDALKISIFILKGIVDAIRTKGEAINKAPTLEDIVAIVLDGISTQLGEVGRGAETGQVIKELEATFAGRPSLIDRIASAVLPPFEMEEERLQQLEHMLKQCVLKVIDHASDPKEEDWEGTAFALCKRGHILMPAHVRREGHPLTLIFQGVEYLKREKLRVQKWQDKDIAILELGVQRPAIWAELQDAGLKPPVLAVQDANLMRQHPVLCLGYQTPLIQGTARFVGPAPAEARVAAHDPKRTIEFEEDGHTQTQECLVLVIAEGEERIVEGMSGGPILDLETGEVIAMVTGAQRLGRIHQPYRRGKEKLPLAEYGFGVLLSDVAESWPEFKECCFQGDKP